MAAEPFSLAANVFAVVGAADVVFRSAIELSRLLSRMKSSMTTLSSIMDSLEGLTLALQETRAWAETFKQSDLAQGAGRVAPSELLPILDKCNKVLNELTVRAKYFLEGNWYNRITFTWNEADIRQSSQLLENFKSTLTLLVCSRTRYVVSV